MEWWQLIFALFVIAAYVIKHIVAAQQEAAAQRERLRAPAAPVVEKSDEDVARERTALDRRIEEAMERRREKDGEEAIVSTLPRRQIPMPVPAVKAPPPPRYRPRPRADDEGPSEVSSPAITPLPRVVRPAPVAKPSAIPLVRVSPEAPKLAAMIAAAAPPVVNPVPTPPPTPISTTPRSAAAYQALDLLRNRETLVAAFVLREILDRPVSQRRRRRY
jgi:hypothetical protein